MAARTDAVSRKRRAAVEEKLPSDKARRLEGSVASRTVKTRSGSVTSRAGSAKAGSAKAGSVKPKAGKTASAAKNSRSMPSANWEEKVRRLAEELQSEGSEFGEEASEELLSNVEDEDDRNIFKLIGEDPAFRVDGNTAAESASNYKTLADIIFESLEDKHRKEAEEERMALFSENTLKMFRDLGYYMKQFKSGKIPRAARVIPFLRNWMDVLWLAKPEEWTPHAIAAITPLFISGLKDDQPRRFVQYVLMPAVLEQVDQHGHLHVQLYRALQKALFNPGAFFKGIFLPTILDPRCSYKKAVILCSVVSKTSYPPLHTAAVLMKISSHRPLTNPMYYALIKLLNKKASLPVIAVRALTQFFSEFQNMDVGEGLPVIWQQCLLTFIQRWKQALSEQEKEGLRQLMKRHSHPAITPEIRRQLNVGVN